MKGTVRLTLFGVAAALLLSACSRDAEQADQDQRLNQAAATLDARNPAPPDNGTTP